MTARFVASRHRWPGAAWSIGRDSAGTLATGRPWRRGVAAIIAASLVVRLLAALILLSTASPGEDRRIPICTADGLKWIILDARGSIVPHDPPSDDSQSDDSPSGEPTSGAPGSDRPCPYLLAGSGGVPFLVPVAPHVSVPPRRPVRRSRTWSRVAPALCLAARPPPSRAPPFLSH